MALTFTTGLKNTLLDAIETAVGVSARLIIYSGTPPSVNSSPTGTVLVDMTLPENWMAAASGGSKALTGTWSDLSANATGTATYFRILNSNATTSFMQGTVGTSGADLILTTTDIVFEGTVSITGFTLTAGN
jgi:hypothetical protein